jgi:hypothetical protein
VNKHKPLFTWIIPLIFALAGTAWGNLIFLDEYLVSYRRLFASSAWFAILFLFAWLILRAVPEKERMFKPLLIWLIPALIAIPLSLAFPGTLAYLEKHNLEITAKPGGGEVDFAGINTGNFDVPLSQVIFSREWQKTDYGYQTTSGGSITWTGRVSSHPTVIVYTGPEMGRLQVAWDGKSREYSLNSDTSGESPITTHLPVHWYLSLLYFTVFWVFFFLLLFILFLLLRSFSLEENTTHRRGFWVKYALPFFLVSGFMLLVFFPGMMSGDSLIQWRQAHSLVLSDIHPVFHTLTIWLAIKVWDSPAMVVILQILFMGLVLGWGMGRLVKRGLPEKAAWAISILFALIPANMIFPVSIWKDVPYAASLFWFTLILVEIYFSRGEKLKTTSTITALVVSGLFTSLFRHNGWPVVLFSFLVLILVYRSFFRWAFLAAAMVFILHALITGPLYQELKVTPSPTKLVYEPVLYHIAAHLKTDAGISPDLKASINEVMPIEKWKYDRCSSNPITYDPAFKDEHFQNQLPEYLKIALTLFLKDPLVDLQAVNNLGAFVYRINPDCPVYISPLSYQSGSSIGAGWIDFYVDDIAREKPILPVFVKPLARLFSITTSYYNIRLFYVLFWAPLTYLILLILTSIGFLILQKRWDFLAILSPALFQSLSMVFLAPVQHTRYQYGLIVISIYSVALFLWAYYDSKKASTQKEDE